MKKILFILSFVFGWLFSSAQAEVVKSDFWKIKWNKKTILESGKENEAANTKRLNRSDLGKKFTLEISYVEADLNKETHWNRSFLFYDENDKQLLKTDSTSFVKIKGEALKSVFGDKKKIRIYTIAIPSDPDLAARVRVRRVHLCTLELI